MGDFRGNSFEEDRAGLQVDFAGGQPERPRPSIYKAGKASILSAEAARGG
jgi:hypothetical protein